MKIDKWSVEVTNNPFRISGKNCKDCGESPITSYGDNGTGHTRCGCGNMIISNLDISSSTFDWFVDICRIAETWNERFG